MVLLRPTLKILRARVCVWSARMCVWWTKWGLVGGVGGEGGGALLPKTAEATLGANGLPPRTETHI